jgi:hypothetical protein
VLCEKRNGERATTDGVCPLPSNVRTRTLKRYCSAVNACRWPQRSLAISADIVQKSYFHALPSRRAACWIPRSKSFSGATKKFQIVDAIGIPYSSLRRWQLQGSALDVHIEQIRPITTGIWLVWTKGGITKANGSAVERTGESVQLFVFREQEAVQAIEAFFRTPAKESASLPALRLRPVTDSHSAEVWRQFDRLWAESNRR